MRLDSFCKQGCDVGMQSTVRNQVDSSDQKVNILLVDDQPSNLLALEAILDDLGPNLIKSTSGEEALQKLETLDFAVVLLDVQMHGLDGFETAKQIRSRERSRHTPIIFITAYESHHFPVDKAYSLGAVDYLVKPLIPVILRAKVAGFVDIYQKAARLRQLEREQFERKLNEESRLAEAKLRATEERFAGFMQHLPGLAWIKDLQGRYVYANEAAMKVFGRFASQLYGKTDDEVFSPETAARFKQNDQQAIGVTTGIQVIETLKHDDGLIHHSIVNKFPIMGVDGEPMLVGGIAVDISDRIRVEETLRFLSAASATLAEVIDYETTLQKVASLSVPYFADWCAVDMAAPVGSPRRLALAHVDPRKIQIAQEIERRSPIAQRLPDAAFQVLKAGKSALSVDVAESEQMKGKSTSAPTSLLPVLGLKSFICVPLKVRDRVLGVLTFVMGESLRRFSQSDLAFAEELARRAAIAVENSQLYGNLREADRLKDEFLAMLAHELRNPLAPIRNALQILKMPTADSAMLDQVRDTAERQVQHMARLLDDLLDVSRISRGRIELRRELVDVASIVHRSVEAVHSVLEERHHRLTISLPSETLRVDGDPTRLEQVLTNLLNNAAKYTDSAGQITVCVERAGTQVVIKVKDTGIGIAPESLSRIFDLFVQAERRLDRSQGGVGIGLTLVRKLVELHGGTVEAFSEGLGKGSTFVVRLPTFCGEPQLRNSSSPSADNSGSNQTRRVLVVDDSHDAADTLSLFLKLSGHDVQTAYGGGEALKAVTARIPELIFLDIGMPGLDGLEVARRIRSDPALKGITLIAMTGWGQDEDRRRTKAAGFDFHLVKPVEPSDLKQFLVDLQPPVA